MKTLSCQGESFKCQLHTTHVGSVGWELHSSSTTTCAAKADHGFRRCVSLALICLLKIVNLTVLLNKEREILTLHSKLFEILKLVFCAKLGSSHFA